MDDDDADETYPELILQRALLSENHTEACTADCIIFAEKVEE